MQATKTASREGAVTMNAPTYTPPSPVHRRNKHNRKTLVNLMGVSTLLKAARTVLALEEGEVDVDEDEHGLFFIRTLILFFFLQL